jgi:ribosome maturation factor RimP
LDKLNKESELYKLIEPLTAGFSTAILDLRQRFASGLKIVSLTVVSTTEKNITIDKCAEISRTVLPELELEYGRDKVSLEVSSPGLMRKIKHSDEFTFFTGKSVRIITESNDTIEGEIISSGEESVCINADSELNISFAEIKKAKLLYSTQGGR